MISSLDIYRKIFGTWESPIATIEVPHLHLKLRDCGGATEGRECEIRARLLDKDGGYATDFEHDGASSLSISMAVTNEQIITEDWFEVAGVITEVRAWGAPFEQHTEGDAWEGAHDCETCTGQHEGAEPHKMVEHYIPPEAYKIITEAGKLLPVYGRYAVLRWRP